MPGRYSSTLHSGFLFLIALLASTLPIAAIHAQEEDDPRAIRDFNTAAELQNSGLYARAGEKWQKFIADYKNDKRLDRATYNLGVSHLHTKKFEEAIRAFQEVAAKYPKFSSLDALRYNLGMAHYLKGADSQQAADFTNAAKAFAEVAEKHAESAYADRALYFQGEALFTTGAGEASRAAFATLVSKYPKSALLADASYALGTAQQEAELYPEAIKTYSNFLAHNELKNHEYATEIRLRLGMSLFATKAYAEAEKQFEQVAPQADFPNADFALLRQAQCRYELNDIAKSAELNLALAKKYPESLYIPTAQLAAGKCFYQLEKWNEAVSALSALAKQEGPAQLEAAYWLSRTLLRQEKPQEALALLEQTAKNVPADHPFAPHVKLARLDSMYAIPERRKETAGAYAEFAQQFASHELAPQAQYMAALVSLEQEDLATAREQAEKYLANAAWKEASFTPSVLFIAGEAHLLGAEAKLPGADVAKAEAYYRRLATEYPTDPRLARSNLRIGWILYRGGKHTDAAQYLSSIAGSLTEPEHKAEAFLLIGRSQLDSNQPGPAIGQLEQAVAVKNDWPRIDEALILLAQAYRAENKPKEASERLSRLESQFKQSVYRGQALYMLGEIAQEQANWDEAATRYQAVLSTYGDDTYAPLAAYGLGAVRIAQQQYEPAEQAFTSLLEKYKESDTTTLATYWRGLARHRQQKFATAITDLQQFVTAAKQPNQTAAAAKLADALYTIALCQIGEKQLAAATGTLTTLLKDHPQYTHRDKAYYELGHSYLAAQQSAEATEAFRSLVAASAESPLAAEAYFHIGSANEQQAAGASEPEARKKEWAAAETAFSAGLKSATVPELKEKLQYKLGDMQFRQDNFTAAAQTLEALLKESPKGELSGAARYLAAESLFRMKQFAQALPMFEQVAAEKIEPYTAQAYYRAGAAAAALENWQASENAFRKLLEQQPDFPLAPEAQYGLAWAQQNQNELDEAVKLYEQLAAKSTSETAAKARFMVGEIAFGKKEYNQAIEHFLETAAGYPYPEWQGLARLEAGRCFMQLKKPEEAKKQFQIIAQNFPDHPKAADAARLLTELNK